ncbi:MAG TPA: hypothetical protein VKA98_06965 [Nitrososphaeraceae archaeon]|nr:hypothetical protein [Nitrososphaeraceae archaeon]
MEALVKLGTAASVATRTRQQSGISSDQLSSGFKRKDTKILKVITS